MHSGAEAMLSHIREGVTSGLELAELLGVQRNTISKWAKTLHGAGKIARPDGTRSGYSLKE